jgi:HEPN domain-containing protein
MREEIELWWEQARHDRDTAQVLLDSDRLDAATFYVQQAVEKALKAVYIALRQERHAATHSLTALGREVGVPPKYRGFLRRLTPEYFLSRYPDASGDVPFRLYEREEVAESVALAGEVLEWAEQQLTR